jgi:hypothetical protein
MAVDDYGGGGDLGPLPPMGGGSFGGGSKINFEGLVPIILLILVGVASLNYFNVLPFSIPLLPKSDKVATVVFIGSQTTLGEQAVLSELRSLNKIILIERTPDSFSYNTSETFQDASVVILDLMQPIDTANGRRVNYALMDSLKKYVEKGGKLIVVGNSGVYIRSTFSNSEPAELVGWQSNLTDLMPVDCGKLLDGRLACQFGSEIPIYGTIDLVRTAVHPIVEGLNDPTLNVLGTATAYPLQLTKGAKAIAMWYKKDGTALNSSTSIIAISEKKNIVGGTVIHFNYDPGVTTGLFMNALKYLSGMK